MSRRNHISILAAFLWKLCLVVGRMSKKMYHDRVGLLGLYRLRTMDAFFKRLPVVSRYFRNTGFWGRSSKRDLPHSPGVLQRSGKKGERLKKIPEKRLEKRGNTKHSPGEPFRNLTHPSRILRVAHIILFTPCLHGESYKQVPFVYGSLKVSSMTGKYSVNWRERL